MKQNIDKKFYTKWWFWVIIAVIFLGILGLVIPGNSINDNSDNTYTNEDIYEKPITKSWHYVTSFSGKGNQDTSSFYIKGSKVKITATTCCGSTKYGTYSGIDLESEEGGYLGAGLSISTDGFEEGHGETIYRNLDAGEYYISVITGVSWEVEVEDYY